MVWCSIVTKCPQKWIFAQCKYGQTLAAVVMWFFLVNQLQKYSYNCSWKARLFLNDGARFVQFFTNNNKHIQSANT